MTSALAYKEFRETIGIAGLGLAALLLVAQASMGWDMLPTQWLGYGRGSEIPFLNDSFVTRFAVAAFLLAAALGMRQSLGDLLGDAYLFLLHRPIARNQVYAVKLAIGLSLYLVCAALPVLLYAWWASLPGTHASPFEWSMTTRAWLLWLAMTAGYLGAFLAGIRPANWFGTRLAPLAAALGLIIVLQVLPMTAAVALLVVVDVVLIGLILHVAERRDFPG